MNKNHFAPPHVFHNPLKHTRLLLCLACIITSILPVAAQPTAFTYQGRLATGTGAATGLYDFQFTLYGSESGSDQVGLPNLGAAIPVSNGLFTATLDFGNQFSGAGRWLGIGVRTNGASTFAPLTPRQALTPTPYALFSPNSGNAATAVTATTATTALGVAPGAVTQLGSPGGAITNALQVNARGFIGVGTTNPLAGLQLASGPSIYSPNLQLQVKNGVANYTKLSYVSTLAVSTNHLLAAAGWDGGVTLMDITYPGFSFLRSQFSDGDGTLTNLAGVYGLAFNGSILAVAAQFDNAVTILSVSNPAAPLKLAELRDGVGAYSLLGGAMDVAFSTSNLLAVSGLRDNAVTLVNMSNPNAPTLAGYIQHGFNGFSNMLSPSQLKFSGNLLAVVANDSYAVNLIDVSNPSLPQLRSTIRQGVGGFTNLIMVDASIAISTGNILAIAADNSRTVTLVDISNPASPVLRSIIKPGVDGYSSQFYPRRVAFSGNLLAISSAVENSVTLVDVSNPSNPVRKGYFPNGQAGLYYLNQPEGVVWDGDVLAIAGSRSAGLTLLQPVASSVDLVVNDFVGIGTALPEAPLHVVGNMIVQGADNVTIHATHMELGNASIASGTDSTAMGSGTVASGDASTAMGIGTTASGLYSTAAGINTLASGAFSTAIGADTVAIGDRAAAIGAGTYAIGDASTALGNASKSIGVASFASGFSTLAVGDYSTAMGQNTKATGVAATAMGYGTAASNNFATAMGHSTLASGLHSTAIGHSSTASGLHSTAIGNTNTASGESSTAIGDGAKATGLRSTAIGYNTLAKGNSSIAMGQETRAIGNLSTAMGYNTGASNSFATAMGHSTTASGLYSTAMGRGTIAANDDSTAMGFGTTASGWDSTAMGTFSIASGHYSVAAGFYAEASHQGSFVWADSSSATRFTSAANNEFAVRASGGVRLATPYLQISGGGGESAYIGGDGGGGDVEIGSRNPGIMNVGFWNSAAFSHMNVYGLTFNPGSDRNLKQDFKAVDPLAILDKVVSLPVTEWAYKADSQTRHLGPVAQDFMAAFNLGSSDKSIATVDADGVALSAIQGLNQKLEQKLEETRAGLRQRELENAELRRELSELRQIVGQLAERLGPAR